MLSTGKFFFSSKELETDLLVTGLEYHYLIFYYYKINCGIYDFLINAGIAGVIILILKQSDVLNITSDSFADIVINEKTMQNQF
jgi:hypothetical protein